MDETHDRQLTKLPKLVQAEADRAKHAESALSKAGPDDPKHPGWPKGTPDGVGGEYRPKAPDAEGAATHRMQQITMRRAFRTGLRALLNPQRLARLTAESAANAVPVLDLAADVEALYETKKILDDFENLRAATDAALKFAAGGPRSLEELQVSPTEEAFPTMDSFEKEALDKRFGKAGPGYEYHHIVEQGANDVPPEGLHSTRNIVRIPKLLHEEVTAEYARVSTKVYARATVRTFLRSLPYEERYRAGLETLRSVGILKSGGASS